jgi:hypothetical protein
MSIDIYKKQPEYFKVSKAPPIKSFDALVVKPQKKEHQVLPSRLIELFKLARQQGKTLNCQYSSICLVCTAIAMFHNVKYTHEQAEQLLLTKGVKFFGKDYRFNCGNCKAKGLDYFHWGEPELWDHIVTKHVNSKEHSLQQIIDVISKAEEVINSPNQVIRVKVDPNGNTVVLNE